MTATPSDRRHQIGQLSTRQLDLYSSQLARCLKALGADAPIRADVQRELATVHAEQDARAAAAHPAQRPCQPPGFSVDPLTEN